MKARMDLTRWNRAGLSRFRYVDGNAVEYLEILRQQLVKRFAGPQTKHCAWLNPPEQTPEKEVIPSTETLIERQERLGLIQERILASYHQDRRDWAWEISRAFARACHILTEHADAYANERFLGTATQWEHVRRLVEMLDYHPAPPASALAHLALIAKDDKTGTVAKGFQVKHSPPNGGPTIIFETLEDVSVDPALNELRPKGWDRSDAPPLQADSDGTPQPPAEEQKFSSIANQPAIHLQGVGQVSAGKLNTLAVGDGGVFMIKDFLYLDPDNLGLDIEATWLWEWKAKADILINFAPEADWSVIAEWLLPDISEASAASLAELSGNSLEMAGSLKKDIEIIDICLDRQVFLLTPFKDLVAPAADVAGSVATYWRAKRKPKIVPDEVAMIYREVKGAKSGNYTDEAEAATIDSVDKQTQIIHLRPSPFQTNWYDWKRSEARLKVSPRWQRRCWLNGSNVIRTRQPHGLSDGAFVSWKIGEAWTFAKVTEVDKRNLRLMLTGPLPGPATPLHEARPLEGPNLPAEVEEVGLIDEALPADAIEAITAASLVDHETPEFPKVISTGPTDPLDPLSLIPSIFGKLPEVGSFIVPTPLLPIDLVKAAVKLLLKIGAMVIPSTGEPVFEFMPPEDLAIAIYNLVLESESVKWESEDEDDIKRDIEAALNLPEGAEPVFFNIVKQVYLEKGPFLVVPKDPEIKAVVEPIIPRYVLDGRPGKIESGDWVVGRFTDGLSALNISAIEELADGDNETFGLEFDNLAGSEGELQMVYADFRGELAAEGADRNSAPVEPGPLELEDDIPPSLSVGRSVLLTAEGKAPVAAKITGIAGNAIATDPPPDDFTQGELIIRGNVVLAGHGEGKPAKILGSGDAARSHQEFTLAVAQVSFTPDSTKSAGVAAAIDVDVAGRIWEQVSTLKDSAPDDHHYTVRMTEDGFVKINFGDGEHGRRLPTGKNNVRVRYRVGSGLGGNLPAGSLEKPVKPHRLVTAVLQPINAAGGGDMEDVAALRENAPATLLVLERAVSLSDFAHLAVAQSSVWQAKAYSQILHGGRTESVRVVIVPAGGVRSEEINEATRSYLQKHTLPGVQVAVENFNPVLVDMKIVVRVRYDAFVAEDVKKAVAAALVDHFTLKKRKLGEHLYLSEVFKVVERVNGVENSTCEIFERPIETNVSKENKALQVIQAKNESTVVYLDTEAENKPSTLTVTAEEYRL